MNDGMPQPKPKPKRAPLPPWWWKQTLRTRRVIALCIVVAVVLVTAGLLSRLFRDEPLSSTIYVATMSAERRAIWDDMAECESGGDWTKASGNGYYGGLQFSTTLWAEAGGEGLPSDASEAAQIMRADMVQMEQGWAPWPACSSSLGLQG